MDFKVLLILHQSSQNRTIWINHEQPYRENYQECLMLLFHKRIYIP